MKKCWPLYSVAQHEALISKPNSSIGVWNLSGPSQDRFFLSAIGSPLIRGVSIELPPTSMPRCRAHGKCCSGCVCRLWLHRWPG